MLFSDISIFLTGASLLHKIIVMSNYIPILGALIITIRPLNPFITIQTLFNGPYLPFETYDYRLMAKVKGYLPWRTISYQKWIPYQNFHLLSFLCGFFFRKKGYINFVPSVCPCVHAYVCAVSCNYLLAVATSNFVAA